MSVMITIRSQFNTVAIYQGTSGWFSPRAYDLFSTKPQVLDPNHGARERYHLLEGALDPIRK